VAAWIVLILYCIVGPLVVLTLVVIEMVKRSRRTKAWRESQGAPAARLRKATDSEVSPSRPLPSVPRASLSQRWRTEPESGQMRLQMAPLVRYGVLALACWTAVGYVSVVVVGRSVGLAGQDAWLILGVVMACIVVLTAIGALLVKLREKREDRE
jgi:hypothetical protein